jgi:hypothetical protein
MGLLHSQRDSDEAIHSQRAKSYLGFSLNTQKGVVNEGKGEKMQLSSEITTPHGSNSES